MPSRYNTFVFNMNDNTIYRSDDFHDDDRFIIITTPDGNYIADIIGSHVRTEETKEEEEEEEEEEQTTTEGAIDDPLNREELDAIRRNLLWIFDTEDTIEEQFSYFLPSYFETDQQRARRQNLIYYGNPSEIDVITPPPTYNVIPWYIPSFTEVWGNYYFGDCLFEQMEIFSNHMQNLVVNYAIDRINYNHNWNMYALAA